MDQQCSDGESSDSMAYPSDDETSAYERRILKIKRRRERAFFSQFKQGETTKASQLLPKTKDNGDEKLNPDPQTPHTKKTYKRRSVPAVQARKSERLDGKIVNYADNDRGGQPIDRRKQNMGGKRRYKKRDVEFNPGHLRGKICYNSHKVYSKNGTTCHQCRQKTIDLKSRCYSPHCRGLRGMFCGFCLLQRYGEDVAVVLHDPKWKCPPCRNICNCSICRRRYGKEPTGQLFHRVSCEGFTNVKDFLAVKKDHVLIGNAGEEQYGEPLEDEDKRGKGAANKENSRNTVKQKRTKTSPKRTKRMGNSRKENAVSDISSKEEHVDQVQEIDPSLYPNVDFKPVVMLEKLEPACAHNDKF